MIDTIESTSLVLDRAFKPVPITVPLESAQGEILCEDLKADRDFPPYNRVAMDGIALHTRPWSTGKKSFAVEGVQASGSEPLNDCNPDECIEIMTGAALPPQYNTVVRYEDVTINRGTAVIHNPVLEPVEYLNIHRMGSDNIQGDILLTAGTRLSAPQIGIAASIGKTELKVARRPVLSIIATGDELVPVADSPLPHQVRISNAYAIRAAIEGLGFKGINIHHIRDSKTDLKDNLKNILFQNDLVILSGGVSRGKFDFIPEILEELGVKKIFHKVKQKPGKPLWFGEQPSESSPKVVFGLPGNPVSAVVNCYKYILPFLKKSMGQNYISEAKVNLKSIPRTKPSLTNYIPVALNRQNGDSHSATLVKGNGSGDLTSLGATDGFVEILPGDDLAEGSLYSLYTWEEN